MFGVTRTDGAQRHEQPLDMIAFTGSTTTAKQILKTILGRRLVRTHIEAGGSGNCIVSKTAKNHSEIARFQAKCSFCNQSQICSKTIRYFLAREISDELLEAFVSESSSWIPCKNPSDPSAKIGGMISTHAADSLCAKLEESLEKSTGLSCLTRGPTRAFGTGDNPFIVAQDCCAEFLEGEEVFGPLAIFSIYDDFTDVNKAVSKIDLALEIDIYSNGLQEIEAFFQMSPSGVCSVNSWGSTQVGFQFGGNRQSGNGLEKCAETLNAYTVSKYIYSP